MASQQPKRKADLKIVILGSANVGKTTLINRYIQGKFQETISTIGASFSLKQWGQYNVAIWDTAGEERYAGLSSFYCRGAGAAILAFDLSSEDSFNALRGRFLQLTQTVEDNCLFIVVGTKQDLVKEKSREVSTQDGLLLAQEVNTKLRLKDIPYFETSSVTGQNVNRVFDYILNYVLPLDGSAKPKRSPSGVVELEKSKKEIMEGGKKSGCC